MYSPCMCVCLKLMSSYIIIHSQRVNLSLSKKPLIALMIGYALSCYGYGFVLDKLWLDLSVNITIN